MCDVSERECECAYRTFTGSPALSAPSAIALGDLTFLLSGSSLGASIWPAEGSTISLSLSSGLSVTLWIRGCRGTPCTTTSTAWTQHFFLLFTTDYVLLAPSDADHKQRTGNRSYRCMIRRIDAVCLVQFVSSHHELEGNGSRGSAHRSRWQSLPQAQPPGGCLILLNISSDPAMTSPPLCTSMHVLYPLR